MNFTRASYHFASRGIQQPAATLYIHTDGYPEGAASFLRAMLLQEGTSTGQAFQQANQNACVATDPAGDEGTSFRYWLDGNDVRAEERTEKGQDHWNTLFSGTLLAFINRYSVPMLHHVGPSAQGPDREQYSTLETVQAHFAQAAIAAVRYEAGVLGGGMSTLENVGYLRAQLGQVLRAEIAGGQVEGTSQPPQLFTVVGEYADNEQGFTTTVVATDDDHAIELAQAEAEAILSAGRDELPESEEEEPTVEPLYIWAVLRGAPDVVYVKSAA